ncbi:acyl-CoA dehydrogenase family protein [Catellatospora sp. KI3]|uniref:acyl-CoA dehydrogenase family protein n=1 Tax=Catellatospora sp. KI3 TaxID=3041620 RepID=UPI0024827F93|nr:acyl-CoA dehydrogenase family protein [Catellatospora sp. KI3]MDI1461125.1 acyl-CoA dehydrogenase family protein [Catellatospora sp. KI3]
MRFLERERAVLGKLLPGLDEALAALGLTALERPGSPGIAAFRDAGGPGLLVATAHGGAGATAVQAIQVQRAIGARSPSLAVATTMHHFSMAGLVVVSEISNGFEWMLMEGIARESKLLASGFAEGTSGQNILAPGLRVAPADGGVRVTGAKRPCSLSASMDLLTASILVPRLDGTGDQLAIALIPAGSDGMSVSPFWGSFALAGAESDQVVLDDVFVPDELLVRTDSAPGQALDGIQIAGFLWFEVLMTASYLGAASALVERVLGQDRIPELERVRLVCDIEAAMAAVETIAARLDSGARDAAALAESLYARYAAQDAIARIVPRAVELLGGMAYFAADDVAYLSACANGLSLHPPSRSRMAGPLVAQLAGQPLTIA